MIIISVGGSLISPTKNIQENIGTINCAFISEFKKIILGQVKRGQKFIIVTGGGGTCRSYVAASIKLYNKVKEVDRHWVGIMATRLNAELFRVVFESYSNPRVAGDPSIKVKLTRPILIAAGWLPGHSSDMDAAILAKTYGAKQIINLTNVDYIYSEDPKKNKNAVAYPKLSWVEYKNILGIKKFAPAAHAPFDPIASAFAQKNKLEIIIANGENLKNFANILNGKEFKGTRLS